MARDPWFEWLTSRRQGGDGDRHRATMELLRPVRDSVLDHAALRRGETVLDVGAGDGLIAFGALERVAPDGIVVFSDISRDLLDHCAEAARELGVEGRCRFVEAPADDLGAIGDASVDAVTVRSVLIYVQDKASALREFHRVLRPGGRVSLYEPINRLMCEPGRLFGGFDLEPVAHIEAKLEALYQSYQDPESDPMLDFDERDLVALAVGAGFEEVHLGLRVDISPGSEPVPWEIFLNSSGNPLIPTVGEAMATALTPDEALELESHLRPLVELGRGRRKLVTASLWATKLTAA